MPLDGQLLRAGVRRPIAGVTVRFAPSGDEAITDLEGRFRVLLPLGPHRATIDEAGFAPWSAQITLKGPQRVEWRLRPEGEDAARVRVVGRARPGSHTVRGPLLRQLPGTMGDPLRVVQALPGVGTVQALVPHPVVRGAQPGETGYVVDGAPIPLLFHAGVLTSVIQPRLLDSVTLHPGMAPIRYGRRVGGVVVAKTAQPPGDTWLANIDLDLVQAGVFVSAPLFGGDARLSVGGRYSYTSAMLGLFAPDLSLDFADYALRYDHRIGRTRLRITALGALDRFEDASEPNADLARTDTRFDRLLLRLEHPLGEGALALGVDLGYDRLVAPGEWSDPAHLEERHARAFGMWSQDLGPALAIQVGLDAALRRPEQTGAATAAQSWRPYIATEARKGELAAWTELSWRAGPLTLIPGVRVDHTSGGNGWTAMDPRLTAHVQAGVARVTAQLGVTHAPQRFFVAAPGLGDLEKAVGPQRARQTALTVSRPLGEACTLQLTGWRTWIDNAHQVAFLQGTRLGDLSPDTAASRDGDRVVAREARAFGLEGLLRWQTARLAGWIALTLQRAEQRLPADAPVDTAGVWQPAELDQRLLLNAVISWAAGDGWRLGGRLHLNTGRPVRAEAFSFDGDALDTRLERLDPYWQVDLRLDHRWRLTDWSLTAYLDVLNAGLQAENIAAGRTRDAFVLPTLGVSAAF